MSEKTPQERLEGTFKELLDTINAKFEKSGAHVDSLGMWISGNLKRMEKELKSVVFNSKVLDFALTAVVQLLEEKKVLQPGEYKERANKLVKDSQIEVVKKQK